MMAMRPYINKENCKIISDKVTRLSSKYLLYVPKMKRSKTNESTVNIEYVLAIPHLAEVPSVSL